MHATVRASEQDIEFSGISGPGIVVEFGRTWRLTFWSEAYFIPCWDLGRQWLTHEWLETGSTENMHCYEPMMDYELRYTRARIVQEGPARAVVHWHYALCDNRFRVFHGNTTADETYTVYPDGIAIRKLVGWPGDESDFGGNPTLWEVGEWIVLNPAGMVPETTLRSPALTLTDLAGDVIEMGWPYYRQGPRSFCSRHPGFAHWGEYIGRVNFVDQPSPFAAFPRSQTLFPHVPCSACGEMHPEIRPFVGNQTDMHLPSYKRADYVGWKRANDEVGKIPTTTSLASYGYGYGYAANPMPNGARTADVYERFLVPPRPTTWLSLQGVTDSMDLEGLRKVVASWLHPPRIDMATPPSEAVYEGYAFAQRAHEFRILRGGEVSFDAAPTAAVVNPVFLLNGWPSDGVRVRWGTRDVEPGAIRTQREGDDLVVWVEGDLTYPLRIVIEAV